MICLLALVALVAGCGGSKTKRILPARDLFEMGMTKYNQKKYFSAVENFQSVVFNYPGETMVDTAQYYLALSYFGQNDYPIAEVEFNRLMVNYPSSVYTTTAQFMKAVCAFEATPHHFGLDQSSLDQSIKQFEDFLVDHPESESAPEAQRYLAIAKARQAKKLYSAGVVYTRINALDAAAIYFQRVVDDHTDSEYGPRALFQLGELDFKRKKYGDSESKFRGFVAAYPGHEWKQKAQDLIAESSFRNAELAFKSGETETARKRLETFKETFPQDKRLKKIDDYLKQLGSRSLEDSTAATASGN